LLYLTDCPEGGETRLLKSLNPAKNKTSASGDSNTTSNTNICDSGILKPEFSDSGVLKPEFSDLGILNPDFSDPGIRNPGILKPDFSDPVIRNLGNNKRNIVDPDIDNPNTYDVTAREPYISRDDNNIRDIDSNILAIIVPKRGRLLVFPHICYHEGNKAISLPKLLLRGEMI
jgi:hypothetical protein